MGLFKQLLQKVKTYNMHRRAAKRLRKRKEFFYRVRLFNRHFEEIPQNNLRNVYYTHILSEYKNNKKLIHKQRYRFKCIFFWIICLSFSAIVGFNCLLLYNLSKHIGDISITDLGVALTGLSGLLSAIIVLPQIIAKHLFPETGEKEEIDLVKSMQEFDNKNIDYIVDNNEQED